MKMVTKPIPVRIAEGLPIVEAAAKKLKASRSRIILFATLTFVEFVERNGTVAMPPNWSDILADKPGRNKKA